MIKLLRPQPDMLEVFHIKIVHPCRDIVGLFSTQQITCSCFESKCLVLVVLHSTIFATKCLYHVEFISSQIIHMVDLVDMSRQVKQIHLFSLVDI